MDDYMMVDNGREVSMRNLNGKRLLILILIGAVLVAVPLLFLISLTTQSNLQPFTSEQLEASKEFNRRAVLGPQLTPEERKAEKELRTEINKVRAGENLRQSLSSTRDLTALLVSHIALFALAVLAFWLVLFRTAKRALPLLRLNKILFVSGATLLLMGPIMGTIRPYQSWPQAPLWPLLVMNLVFLRSLRDNQPQPRILPITARF